MSWWRTFHVKGVFWRQLLRWGVLNIPIWIEPILLGFWSFAFLLWRSGRRGVMGNLAIIKPGSMPLANFGRTYRVFWNFAWTIADNVRFKESRISPDWSFDGVEHYEELRRLEGGAIILTAHMGSYDLGAHLFAETAHRKIVMVRAPEVDPQTQAHEQRLRQRTVGEELTVGFSGASEDLAFDLLHALRRGEIVAIQGDRVVGGISSLPTTLFEKSVRIPSGPFALAMAAGVPIFPLFIVRAGRRHYTLRIRAPFRVTRGKDRQQAIAEAVARWTGELEATVAKYWFQWFNFEPLAGKDAA